MVAWQTAHQVNIAGRITKRRVTVRDLLRRGPELSEDAKFAELDRRLQAQRLMNQDN